MPAWAEAPLVSIRPVPKPDDAVAKSQKSLDQIVAERKLSGRASAVVLDGGTGETLEVFNPLRAHPPASVAKAITADYAMSTLGPGHRFRTRLMATAPIKNGVLDGDLILAGGGDPELDSDDLFSIAARAKEAGLRKLTGRFLVYGGQFPSVLRIDPGQPEHVGYSPAVSGLNLNFNRVFLEWKRNGTGYDMTVDARTEQLRPRVAVAGAAVVDRPAPVFDYADQGNRDFWTVAKRALGRGGGRWLPVRKPELYAGDVFRTVARSHGIVLPYPELAASEPEGGVLLVDHVSRGLTEISRGMLKYSTNLTAEVLGLAASRQRQAVLSLEDSGAAMADWLSSQHGSRKAEFVDHSGLGDRSKMTAFEMSRTLLGTGPDGRLRGLLKKVNLPDPNNRKILNQSVGVVAKTGTLNFVSGLAGFVRTETGRDLVFAIFLSDLDRRLGLTRSEKENPPGSKSWNTQARNLQYAMINRWALVHT